jgi:hypothetical protein
MRLTRKGGAESDEMTIEVIQLALYSFSRRLAAVQTNRSTKRVARTLIITTVVTPPPSVKPLCLGGVAADFGSQRQIVVPLCKRHSKVQWSHWL